MRVGKASYLPPGAPLSVQVDAADQRLRLQPLRQYARQWGGRACGRIEQHQAPAIPPLFEQCSCNLERVRPCRLLRLQW